jgi:hypothetical protein
LNAGVFTLALPAGNYFIEGISFGVATMTGIAAGNMTGSFFLTDAAGFGNIYANFNLAAIAPAAPFLIQTNYIFAPFPRLACKRGGSIYFAAVNTLNYATAVGSLNIWGSNLP